MPIHWRWLVRRTTSGAVGWIVNAPDIKPVVTRDFRASSESVYVVRNIVTEDSYVSTLTKSEARHRFGLDLDRPVVTMVANLQPWKNYPMFLRVARAVLDTGQEAAFVSAGEARTRTILRETRDLADRLRLTGHLHFMGRVACVPDLLRASDVVVLTSDREGMPNVLLEACFAGVPCVSSDNGAAHEIIADERTGFVVSVGNVQEMAQRVCWLLRDEALRCRMGEAARQRMLTRFSAETAVDQLVSIYSAAAGSARAAG